jgi:hypothetical protein
VAALLGDAAMVMGEVGTKLPWFSQKLAEPMGRWMFRADTKAAVVKASGRWLSGVGGVVLGGLTIYEGYKDYGLSNLYGTGMMLGGVMTGAAAYLMWIGFTGPLAIILLILAAVVTVVVAWLKPDEVERWLDKTIHFGKNASGVFGSLDAQIESMNRLRLA